jgi:hypothetical protein
MMMTKLLHAGTDLAGTVKHRLAVHYGRQDRKEAALID